MLKIILYLLHQEKVFVENENAFVIYDLLLAKVKPRSAQVSRKPKDRS